MVRKILSVLAGITHPVVLESLWISYWSRWHIGWMIATFGILIGVSGLLYMWLEAKRQDIAVLLGSNRRFLLVWHALAIGGLWSAVTDPLLYLWLSFFLWMSLLSLAFHLWKEYSFHVYAWSGLSGFYVGYISHYGMYGGLFGLGAVGVAYVRYLQGAHTLGELGRGGLFGVGGGLGEVAFH
ncbi:MAG: hypothetical protein RMJ57_09040, partial [Bacteroidia bacterium]|nr:hypothetical protein [Bacteroidia bacterium]